MNKKNLPKAIRPSGADTGFAASRAAPEPGSVLHHEPFKPATRNEPSGEARPTAVLRRVAASKLVDRFSLWSGAAGFIPLPLADLAVIGGMQIEMLRRISQLYDVPFSKNLGKALIASLAGSMIPASSGAGMMSLLKGVPLAGTAVSFFALPALSSGASYTIGMAFIEHFESGGTLLDFKPSDYRAFVRSVK
jgi:uncharacterized protein (DUF697 family)